MRRTLLAILLILANSAFAGPLGTRTGPGEFESSPVGVGPIVQLLLALLLVGAAIKLALPWIVKRFGGRLSTETGGSIRIEESASFPGGRLYVVEARGRTLLLGATAQSVSCLADLTANDFSEALSQAESQPPAHAHDVLARLERLAV